MAVQLCFKQVALWIVGLLEYCRECRLVTDTPSCFVADVALSMHLLISLCRNSTILSREAHRLCGHLLKQHHPATLVTSCQVRAIRIKFHSRYDISCKTVWPEISEHLQFIL